MTNYKQNATPRIRLEYTWGGERHKLQFRLGPAATASSFLSSFSAQFNAERANLNSQVQFGLVEAANEGSDVFLPYDSVGLAGTGFAYENNENAFAACGLQVLGRSGGGSKVSWTIYGQGAFTNKAMRTTLITGTNPPACWYRIIAGLIGEGQVVAIDGGIPALRPYVNFICNDYLVQKYRQ